MPDHAVKNPTTFLESKPTNGRFLTKALVKGEPLILLKRGFGYSAVQLYSGRIGEVPSQDIRQKEPGEDFKGFYSRFRPLVNSDVSPSPLSTREQPTGVKSASVKVESSTGEMIETFPILNNPFGSVEPDLPEW